MNQNITIEVNHEVLIWARESFALTRNQVTEKTNIFAKRLIQLEEGEKKPTIEELKIFSKTYKRTIATLLLHKPPKEKPLPIDRRTVDSKDIGNFHEKTIMAIRKARALAHSLYDLKNELNIEFIKLNITSSISDDPKLIAKKIREMLQLDEVRQIKNINFALEGYIEKVESLGIAVFQLSLTQDKLRGFSIVDDIMPIICIKRGAEQSHSKTFTLFHELGHILLNEGGICDLRFDNQFQIEKWCNAFAAEVLIPNAEFLCMQSVHDHKENNQKSWSNKELIELASYFHVGPLAILRNLLENNLTTKEFYQEKHEKWNKPPFGKSKNPEGRNIPKETLKEKGRTYLWLAFKAFDQNRINLKDLSDFLGVKLSYISRTRQLLNV